MSMLHTAIPPQMDYTVYSHLVRTASLVYKFVLYASHKHLHALFTRVLFPAALVIGCVGQIFILYASCKCSVSCGPLVFFSVYCGRCINWHPLLFSYGFYTFVIVPHIHILYKLQALVCILYLFLVFTLASMLLSYFFVSRLILGSVPRCLIAVVLLHIYCAGSVSSVSCRSIRRGVASCSLVHFILSHFLLVYVLFTCLLVNVLPAYLFVLRLTRSCFTLFWWSRCCSVFSRWFSPFCFTSLLY